MMRGKKMCLAFGAETIFDDAEFQINDTDKVGVVGVNGSGKTTLLRLLLGEISLDSGLLLPGKAHIGYLPQEIVLGDEGETVWDYLFAGRPIRKLEAELQDVYAALETADGEAQAGLLRRMSKLQAELEYYECYDAEEILLDLIIDMEIPDSVLEMRLSELSGGQKSKMAFARLLFSKPEILLLDEPTNHLDVPTREYVVKFLQNYHGMALIISHDVDFLNRIVNKILFINKVTHRISVYEGDYDNFKLKRAEEKRLRELAIVHQEREIKELADFVLRAKQASRTNHALKRMGQEREKRLEKMKRERLTRERAYKRMRMDIRPAREGAQVPLEVEGLRFGYPGQPILYDDLSFKIQRRERFLIVGENGVGKSTLLKLLMGILAPERGRVYYNPKTDVAYYAQELETLDPERTILENVDAPGYQTWQLRTVLGNFLFYENDVFKKVGILSPGEKARVALCKLLLRRANLLILDEPTNHLDPETQAVIGDNFRDYEGTIVVVSHNPAFVEQIGISRMLVLPYGRFADYSYELLAYFYDLNTPEEEKY